MANNQRNLTVALKAGVVVNIDDVQSGLKCGCICPACGETLVAKKGAKVRHHFSHYTGRNCEYGYETSLHLAAKEILSNAQKIVLPAVYVHFPESYKVNELICAAQEISIEKVELEKRIGDIIPDVVVHAGGKQFLVEIFVTHAIDEDKLRKLRKLDVSTIEIDLSKKRDITTVEDLTQILLSDSPEKKWVYNTISNRYLHRFYQAADKREILSRGMAMQVDHCPIQSRVWRGKPYANFIDDCLYCEYCISSSYEGDLLCSGRRRISSIKDFKVPEEQRIKDSDEKMERLKENAFAAGKCPYCGGKLVERQGKYGDFWGCNNYPHCRFVATVDSQTGEIIMKG
jgi:ssDNA-binding Zn-finger/Zn-ribbon topoisomerase 1